MELPLRHSSAPTTFFDLPPELRNWIYELSLFGLKYTEIDIHNGSAVQMFPHKGTNLQTATSLIKASAQVRAEFAPVLYGRRNMIFQNARIANQWARQVGEMVQYVRDVEVEELDIRFDGRWPSASMAAMQTWMSTMTKMKNLEKFLLPYVTHKGRRLEELPSARFLGKLLLPLCGRIVQDRRDARPQTRTAEALRFVEYLDHPRFDALPIGPTIRCILESKLRTPEEQIEFEEEVLQGIQRLFVSQSDEETEALL